MPMPSVKSPLPSGSSVMLADSWSLAHSFITNVSLTETHTMLSTPASRKAGASSLKRGRWVDEQVGVNAPGREKTTTVLFLNRSSVVTCFQSLPWRTGKVTLGTRWPSRFCSIRSSPWIGIGGMTTMEEMINTHYQYIKFNYLNKLIAQANRPRGDAQPTSCGS